MTGYSHVLQSGSDNVTSIHRAELDDFAMRLRRFNGAERFALCLWAPPPGMNYDQAVGLLHE